MKKLLALLLVLAMVFSMMTMLTACGEDDYDDEDTSDEDDEGDDKNDDEDDDKNDEDEDEEVSLVGTWTGTADLSDMINLMLAAQDMDFVSLSSFKVGVTFVFEDNGKYTVEFDADDFRDALADAIPDMAAALVDYLEGEGVSEEDFEEEYGVTVAEFLEEYYAENLDADSMGGSGNYYLDGNKLYLDGSSSYLTIELSGNRFELTDYSGNDDNGLYMSMFEGVVFKRK